MDSISPFLSRVPFDLTFESAKTYTDPYNEVDLDVVFQSGEGKTITVPAFWNGNAEWRVRFAAPEPGTWTYSTICSDTENLGLHDSKGSCVVSAYQGDHPFFKGGRLRVSRDRRHFELEDGSPFFWLGDTWWMGLSDRLDWPGGFGDLCKDRVEKGYNVIQIVAGPLPDMDSWDDRGKNAVGFPFKENYTGINPLFFHGADLKISHLVQSGLMPCIVAAWGYYLPKLTVAKMKRYWRYLIARYGAFPVTWCIAGEADMPFYLSKNKEEERQQQQSGWSEILAYVKEIDPYRSLVTIHPSDCKMGRDMVRNPEALDFDMLQTGHGDTEGIPRMIDVVRDAVARVPVMPVVNAEVNYEGILGRCYQNVQRLSFYHSIMNGVAGYTYGANGIWQMNSGTQPYGPSPHGRTWGNTNWQEARSLIGGTQVGHGGKYLRNFAWWKWERHPEWLNASEPTTSTYECVAAGEPGHVRLIYVPLCWDPPAIKLLEPDISYEAEYFDPCTGTSIKLGIVTPDANQEWTPPIPPECHDWLISLRRVPDKA